MRTRFIVLLACSSSLFGCFYPADRARLLEQRVDKLNDENARMAAQLKDAQDRLAEALERLQKGLDTLDKAARRSDADIGVQLQKTIEDVAGLRGQVETYQYKVAELESALKRAGDEAERRGMSEDAAKAADAKKKAEDMKRPDEPKEFLKLAEEKAKSGDMPLARNLYNEFLKKWPKDEAVGDAHYLLGETYYSEEKCREALYEYGKVIQDFSKAKAAPNAYLRSSECFKKLKMVAESKLALEELMKQHPKSDAAKTAKTRLAELEKAPAKGAAAPAKKGGK